MLRVKALFCPPLLLYCHKLEWVYTCRLLRSRYAGRTTGDTTTRYSANRRRPILVHALPIPVRLLWIPPRRTEDTRYHSWRRTEYISSVHKSRQGNHISKLVSPSCLSDFLEDSRGRYRSVSSIRRCPALQGVAHPPGETSWLVRQHLFFVLGASMLSANGLCVIMLLHYPFTQFKKYILPTFYSFISEVVRIGSILIFHLGKIERFFRVTSSPET